MGLKNPGAGDYAREIGRGAAKAAIGAIPLVGSFVDLGETVWKIIELYRKGKNVRPYIRKMLDMKDQAPGVPANAFDLEDKISDRLSDTAKMEIVDQIINALDSITQSNSQVPPDFANREAYRYLMTLAQPGNAKQSK